MDYMIRGIDKKGLIRFFVAVTTDTVEKAREIHNTAPVVSAALGRTLTACSIMGVMMKGEGESISLQIRGDGPIGNIVSVANPKGDVKGYVKNPDIDLPLKANGKLNVGGAVGKNGRITVVKDMGLKDPYIGQSDLVSGEIAEDVANYFFYSEQQPSAVNLGVMIDRDMTVKASGGYIVQPLPDAGEDDISRLEESIKRSEPISSLVNRGLTPEEIAETVFKGFELEILESIKVEYKCDCSREKIESALLSLDKKEIESMIEEDNGAEVVCYFCNSKYNFSKEDLETLINS